jgi:uncharacterized protein (TIGR02996 family)
MTIEDVFKGICENPENDELRVQFADLVEDADPDQATYIRLELTEAQRRRAGLPSYPGEGCSGPEAARQYQSLIRHEERWAHNLSRFLPKRHSDGPPRSDGLMFDRGFPSRISIHPFVFLEYADLLFRLAPIRHIRFREPYDMEEFFPGPVPRRADGTLEPFPLDEILAMPQLARLDSFGFQYLPADEEAFPKDMWRKVAACPHLTRCRVLDIGRTHYSVRISDLELLAAGPLTQKMIQLEPWGVASDLGEQEVLDVENGYEVTKTVFSERGKELERKHGYIPWLHRSHCQYDRDDIAYHVERGALPKYPADSPPQSDWYEFPTTVNVYQPWREW